jgi:hypothetical protein
MIMNPNERIYRMTFASVYPLYVAKAERKGRTRAEVDEIIRWLTCYDDAGLARHIASGTNFEAFFAGAHPPEAAERITGIICGHRVEEIEDSLVRRVRQLDKLIDELAKGRPMEKILRR